MYHLSIVTEHVVYTRQNHTNSVTFILGIPLLLFIGLTQDYWLTHHR